MKIKWSDGKAEIGPITLRAYKTPDLPRHYHWVYLCPQIEGNSGVSKTMTQARQAAEKYALSRIEKYQNVVREFEEATK